MIYDNDDDDDDVVDGPAFIALLVLLFWLKPPLPPTTTTAAAFFLLGLGIVILSCFFLCFKQQYYNIINFKIHLQKQMPPSCPCFLKANARYRQNSNNYY
jgi:hypothetical protein